jgi:hypothetical protein
MGLMTPEEGRKGESDWNAIALCQGRESNSCWVFRVNIKDWRKGSLFAGELSLAQDGRRERSMY